MKTADFTGALAPNGQIAVPPGERIDTAWRAAGRERFEAAYAEDDSVYELLIRDTSTR